MSPHIKRFALILAACLALPLAGWAQSGPETCTAYVWPGASVAGAKRKGKKGETGPGTGANGLDLANFDRSVSPCKDFYDFAAGGWIASHQIPPAYPAWGLFGALAQKNQRVLHEILDREAADRAKAAPGSNDQKLGDYYASCLNTQQIDSAGTKPIQPELRRIAAIANMPELEAEVARLQAMGARVLFNFGSTQDFKNSSQEIASLFQGGLGMPDRDDYLKGDPHTTNLRDEYEAHVAKMFELLGDPAARAAAEAKTVLMVETQLAQDSMSRVEERNPENRYHKMGLAQVQALTPNFSWKRYLTDVGFPSISTINVAQPKFFTGLNASLAKFPLADWKIYLRWQLVHALAPDISTPFVDANFAFYGQALTGAREIQPRWRRCVEATNRQLGMALGRKYVAQAFPPASKASALKMVHNIMNALRADLATLPWMSPATRAAALDKLNHMMIKIGYPEHWLSYSAYDVVSGPYVENVIRGNRFQFHRVLARVGKPVNRARWGMTPPTVNAYYNPSMNEIVFPAGILQPPFFDPKSDDALNYGGIGAVIGHEMTHGFDDEGSKFDAFGNLKNWWTPDDRRNFRARAGCIANQFDTYVAVGDLHENGHLVLGESIADLGGLTLAYKAFEKTPEFRSRKRIQGFTPQQRFFLAFARIWTGKERPQYIRLMVKINPHPLGRYRVIGPLSNMVEFSHAFGCHGDDPMVRPPADRCKIW